MGAHAFIVLGTVPIKSKDPGAQQYLVLGTVPIKRKKTGVLGAHAFFVLGTVPIMSKPAPLDPAQFPLSRHGHPVQNCEIFFVSKSLGVELVCEGGNPQPQTPTPFTDQFFCAKLRYGIGGNLV